MKLLFELLGSQVISECLQFLLQITLLLIDIFAHFVILLDAIVELPHQVFQVDLWHTFSWLSKLHLFYLPIGSVHETCEISHFLFQVFNIVSYSLSLLLQLFQPRLNDRVIYVSCRFDFVNLVFDQGQHFLLVGNLIIQCFDATLQSLHSSFGLINLLRFRAVQ